MPRFIQVFKSLGIEICISDRHLTIWEGNNKPREIPLTYPQSEKYFLSMRSGQFNYELLKKKN